MTINEMHDWLKSAQSITDATMSEQFGRGGGEVELNLLILTKSDKIIVSLVGTSRPVLSP